MREGVFAILSVVSVKDIDSFSGGGVVGALVSFE